MISSTLLGNSPWKCRLSSDLSFSEYTSFTSSLKSYCFSQPVFVHLNFSFSFFLVFSSYLSSFSSLSSSLSFIFR